MDKSFLQQFRYHRVIIAEDMLSNIVETAKQLGHPLDDIMTLRRELVEKIQITKKLMEQESPLHESEKTLYKLVLENKDIPLDNE